MKTPRSLLFPLLALGIASAPPSILATQSQPRMQDFLQDASYADDWPSSTPAAEGLDEEALMAALAFIQEQGLEIHSFTVIRNGKLVFDHYGIEHTEAGPIQRTPDDLHELHSTTKTVTSMLIGMAIAESAIGGVDARVVGFFPASSIENPSPEKDAMRLEDLLTMRSGLTYQEGVDDPLFWDPDSPVSALAFLNRPMAHPPGTRWNYSSGDSQILAEILRNTTAQTPHDYARERLFAPLGIEDSNWYADPSGTHYGGWGLFLTPRDLARFGRLLLNKGTWQGRQIIAASWIEEAMIPRTGTPWAGGDYGYQTWLPEIGGFATLGFMGQDMFLFPGLDLIVVFTAALPSDRADRILLGIVEDFVLPADTSQRRNQ